MSSSVCQAKNPATCRYHSNNGKYNASKDKLGFNSTAGVDVELRKLIPRSKNVDWEKYYCDTDRKHFTDKLTPGSKFLNPELTCLEDLVKLRLHQNPAEGLTGDDRELLISLGSDENGFLPDTRYLIVKTKGSVGIIHSSTLPEDQLVKIERTKHKAPVSITTVVENQPEVNYGVLIISDSINKKHPILITAFPGPVVKPSTDERLEELVDQQMPLRLLKSFLNLHNFWVNTKIV